jgi:AcrR family transcriptional regulator
LHFVTIPRRDGRSTRWDRHRRERRQLIIEAAISAIEEHGPDALTAQIAERAGVPRTHVYRHFDGKPALDLAVSQTVAGRLLNEFRSVMSMRGSARELVHALIEPFLAWVEQNPNLYRFLNRHAFAVNTTGRQDADDAKSVLVGQLTLMTSAYLMLLGAEEPNVGRVVAGVVGLVDGSAAWWLEHGGEPRHELAAALTEEVVSALRRMAGSIGLDFDPDVELPQVTPG